MRAYLLLSTRTLLLAAAVGLAACESRFVTDVDIELEDVATELVVEAYVTPGDTAVVYVSETTRITDSRELVEVPAGTARILVDGAVVAELVAERLPAGFRYYGAGEEDSVLAYRTIDTFPHVAAGAEVRLEVTTGDSREASATAIMPRPARIRSLANRAGQYDDQRFTLSLDDPAGEDAYLITGYTLQVYAVTYQDYDAEADTFINRLDTVENRQNLTFETGDELDYFYYGRRYTVSDEFFDASTGVLNFSSYIYSGAGSGIDLLTDRSALRVSTVPPAAAEYVNAFALADWNEGNPFIEPVIVPDGVEGGRGMLVLASRPVEAEFEIAE